MKKFPVRIIAIVTVLLCRTSVASCPPQYMNETVAPSFTSASQVIDQAVTAVDSALATQLETNSERLVSAVAVLTKQKAMGANQIAEAGRTAAQQVATGLNVIGQTERVKSARFDFGGEFGQGFAPCRVNAARQTIANRDADMAPERRARIASEVVAAPGRYGNRVEAQQQLIDNHQPFCTQSQVDSGLCAAVGERPGADLTVATLFEPAIEGERLYDAKVAFINNAVGPPDGAIPEGTGESPAAAAYALAKSRKDALVSPAIASLKDIQLDYSGVDGSETGTDIPLAVHFQNEVRRYVGNSDESRQWSQVMAAQNERGALVELLKIKALDLAILERQNRSYERMEANLAALVALEVQKSEIGVKSVEAQKRATRQNLKNAVQ